MTGWTQKHLAKWLAALTVGTIAATPPARAQVPQLLSYQGRITEAGSEFNGAGQFKFALVNSNGTATYWSNDGSSSSGSQPNAAVANTVKQGLFFVFLGDSSVSNMTPIPATVFTNSDVRLRIWFSDGTNAFSLLSPDQRIGAVGYAMLAGNISDGAVTSNKLAPGAVLSQSIAINSVTTAAIQNGAVTSAKLAPQSVTTPALAEGSVTSAQLAPAAVTGPALANGAVTASSIADGSVSLSKLNFQLGFINAQNPPYGATGNGTNDDTAAIQSALKDAAAAGGGVVLLPRGNYLITSNLVVPAQTSLVGIWRAPQAFSQNLGTTLLAVQGAGSTSGPPFITLQGNNSTLEGVTIFYPNQVAANPPTPYPWTISGGGGIM